MLCKCGFNHVQALLDKTHEIESYGVIHDKDYRRLMRMEAKTAALKDESQQMKGLFRAARYVGSMWECPECGRLVMLKPEKRASVHEVEYYRREA